MLGSDLLEPLVATGEVRTSVDPFEGRPIIAMTALRPGIAIVHADVADPAGNAAVSGPTWSIRDSALASQRVVVVCEQIVEVGAIDPERVTVPGVAVDAVVHLPHAAHPTAVHDQYDYDREHLAAYAARAREGPESHSRYLDDFVFGVRDHAEYLARAGASR
jgi:glutaconate CoA-transferase subunit A